MLEGDESAKINSECMDWRKGKRSVPVTNTNPYNRQQLIGGGNKYPNNGVNKRVITDKEGNKLKYCPGNRCRVFLPFFQFGYNFNMSDGMDTYCVECNQIKRREKEERRRKSQGFSYCIDKFEEYQLNQYRPFSANDKPVLKRDVTRKIQDYLDKYTEENNSEPPFTSQVLYDKLFNGRRLVCQITGKCLTPSCFMDHHALSLVKDGQRLDVKCNKCNIP